MIGDFITLGIGTPSSIRSLILGGLSANPTGGGGGSSSHIIMMGIGTPSDVTHLVLMGLSANPAGSGGGDGVGVMRRIGYGGGLIST